MTPDSFCMRRVCSSLAKSRIVLNGRLCTDNQLGYQGASLGERAYACSLSLSLSDRVAAVQATPALLLRLAAYNCPALCARSVGISGKYSRDIHLPSYSSQTSIVAVTDKKIVIQLQRSRRVPDSVTVLGLAASAVTPRIRHVTPLRPYRDSVLSAGS